MKLQVSHRTVYTYSAPVDQSQHLVHLRPRRLLRQSVLHHSLLIEPAPAFTSEIIDYFGNSGMLIRLEDEHTEFMVHARSTVEMAPPDERVLPTSSVWENVTAATRSLSQAKSVDALQFVCASRQIPVTEDLKRFAEISFVPHRPVFEAGMDLTQRIFKEFIFDSRATDVATPVSTVLRNRRGVCQDFAHLAIAACRSIGVPARYVSGYLMTRPPAGQAKLKGADASHAWFSIWCPTSGWLDFDPTNGIIPAAEHITLAYGRDYDDISPISGVLLGGGDQTMRVEVDVEPAE